jgi:hypothetical protein
MRGIAASNISLGERLYRWHIDPTRCFNNGLVANGAQMPKLDAIKTDSRIRPASSRDSRRAAARKGWRLLSTGSTGRMKSSGSFAQVTGGREG